MKPRVGISACLLGEPVRYDGDHRRNAFIVEELGRHFEWVAVCPEVEVGFGVPRETLQLEIDGAVGWSGPEPAPSPVRLVTSSTRQDRTGWMADWARDRVAALTGISGFILKHGSPSCGPRGVRVHATGLSRGRDQAAGGGDPAPPILRAGLFGTGLFAQALRDAFAGLPLADEDMLAEPGFPPRFIDEVRAYSRTGGSRTRGAGIASDTTGL